MISVILTAYNEEKYLPEMLHCLQSQSFGDLEIIAVNDGSTDATANVLQGFSETAECRVVVVNQENRGLSASRNNAINLAEGEYIAFVDADDIIPPDYFEKLVLAAKEHDADIVKCSFEDFDEAGNRSGFVSAAARDVLYAPGKRYLFQYSPWAGLLKRSFVEKYNLRFSVGEQMEDSPFALMTNQLASNYAVVDELVYLHRVHSGSIMTNVAAAKKDPKIPYRGFDKAVQTVRANSPAVDKAFSDYCFVRVLTDYVTLRYKTQGSTVRHRLIEYVYWVMDAYFPDFPDNPYLSPNALKELPLFEKTAVRMFARNYKRRTLYVFSAAVSAVLRLKK